MSRNEDRWSDGEGDESIPKMKEVCFIDINRDIERNWHRYSLNFDWSGPTFTLVMWVIFYRIFHEFSQFILRIFWRRQVDQRGEKTPCSWNSRTHYHYNPEIKQFRSVRIFLEFFLQITCTSLQKLSRFKNLNFWAQKIENSFLTLSTTL